MRRFEVKLTAYRQLSATTFVAAETAEQAVELAIKQAQEKEVFWSVPNTPLKDLTGEAFAEPLLEPGDIELLGLVVNHIRLDTLLPDYLAEYLPVESVAAESIGDGVKIVLRKTGYHALIVVAKWSPEKKGITWERR